MQVTLCRIRVTGLHLSMMLDYIEIARGKPHVLPAKVVGADGRTSPRYLSDDSASGMSYDVMAATGQKRPSHPSPACSPVRR